MTTTAEPPVIDILDRAFWQRNPHDAWTWCRGNDPVHRDQRSGIWCITKHADVVWVERRDDLFSSDSAYRLNESPPPDLLAAGGIVAVIPCLVLVLLFHRRIITGLTEGLVKG